LAFKGLTSSDTMKYVVNYCKMISCNSRKHSLS